MEESGEKRPGGLCNLCGYQYPNPHPSAKLRRAHRRSCGKDGSARAAAWEEEVERNGNANAKKLVGGGGGEGNGASTANGGVENRGNAGVKFSQNATTPLEDGHPSEQAISCDQQHQDASTSLHPPESEDGATIHSACSVEEINSSNVTSVASCATGGEISVQTNGLWRGYLSRELSVTDLVYTFKVGNELGHHLKSKTHELTKQEDVNVKLESPYECSLNVNTTVGCQNDLEESSVTLVENKELSRVQLSVEHACQDNSVNATVNSENVLAVTEVDGVINTIGKGRPTKQLEGGELDVSCQEKLQIKTVKEHTAVVEEDPSIKRLNGFFKQDISNEEVESKEQVNLPIHQESCTNMPVGADGDLLQPATGSRHLEAPHLIESKQQIDSTSLSVDQSIVPNQMNIAEGQHSRISARSGSSGSEPVSGAEVISVSSSADVLMESICSPDISPTHSLKDNAAIASDITFVPSQQEISEANKQDQEAAAKEVKSAHDLQANKQNEQIAATTNHVTLQFLLAQTSLETKEEETRTKDQAFRCRAPSEDNALSVQSGPHANIKKRRRRRKQPWKPFICCPYIR